MALTRLSNQSLTSLTALPAAISTGKILQQVHANTSTQVALSSSTLTDTGLRDSTEIGRTGGVWMETATDFINSSISFNVVDSPSSTSALTYKTQFRNINGTSEVAVQKSFGGNWGSTSYITLMEIAG